MPTTFGSIKTTGLMTAGAGLTLTGALIASTTGLFGTSISTPVVFSTGGLLPVVADLNETNFGGDGTASGWSIQNSRSEQLLCKSFVINTTTAPTDGATRVDVSRGTGALTVGAGSGINLFNNYTFAVQTVNSTGSLLYKVESTWAGGTGSILYPLNFLLDANGGTNDYFLLTAGSGTGGGLVADVHVECYSLD